MILAPSSTFVFLSDFFSPFKFKFKLNLKNKNKNVQNEKSKNMPHQCSGVHDSAWGVHVYCLRILITYTANDCRTSARKHLPCLFILSLFLAIRLQSITSREKYFDLAVCLLLVTRDSFLHGTSNSGISASA